MTKICTKCQTEKSLDRFYVHWGTRDARGSWCRCCTVEQAKISTLNNPEKRRQTARKASSRWRARNPDKVRQQGRDRVKTPKYRLRQNLSSRIWSALRGRAKSSRTIELLGCPISWLQVHLESLFCPGMSWENYGEVWHVDHIRPCASFDLFKDSEQKICFHWTNLQPLFALENVIKGAKIA